MNVCERERNALRINAGKHDYEGAGRSLVFNNLLPLNAEESVHYFTFSLRESLRKSLLSSSPYTPVFIMSANQNCDVIMMSLGTLIGLLATTKTNHFSVGLAF